MEKTVIRINDGARAIVNENEVITIQQVEWNEKGYTSVFLLKEEIMKLAEELKKQDC